MRLKISLIIFCVIITVILTFAGVCFGAPSCVIASTSYTFPFGSLDPASTADATATMTIRIKCSGGNPTWFLTVDNGLYYNGATKRMKNQSAPAEYLPYSLTLSPLSGNQPDKIITGTGKILNGDYINAYIGTYADQVTITIAP